MAEQARQSLLHANLGLVPNARNMLGVLKDYNLPNLPFDTLERR